MKWFGGFVVYYKNRPGAMTPYDVGIGYLGRAGGWGPVVPGVCTVHRLVLTPTVKPLGPHAALCPTIKFMVLKFFWSFFRSRIFLERRGSFRNTVALPVLSCDLGRCTKAGARA